MDTATNLAERCRALVRELHTPSLGPPPGLHVGPPPATLEDHLLTTSALVCCLADGHPERDLLRLAALAHDLPDWSVRLDGTGERARRWAELLREHGRRLDGGELPDLDGLDAQEQLLALAHLAASARLPVHKRAEFDGHPLAGAPAVDLVYGGATKIKQYVFESARLPEIRGASALLDHVNRLELPALWNDLPERQLQLDHCRAVRDWFAGCFGVAPLDAPECILYASGGNLLALAPQGWGARLAEAIERRYTEVTQVAASVAVYETAGLLELQYGRRPRDFWADDLARLSDGGARSLVAQSYGVRLGEADDGVAALRARAEIFGIDSLEVKQAAALESEPAKGARKGFGELVTALAAQAARRRAGDGTGTGPQRFPPFVDLVSHMRKCTSCDTRPAVRQIAWPSVQYLCEACRRKRDAGYWAKKGHSSGDAPDTEYAWLQTWGEWLEGRAAVPVEATIDDLKSLGQAAQAASARGFVGLIYADGNNVGRHLARLSSIAEYRRFAQQMLDANERAVARALAAHLAAGTNGVWPFEILTIGGDDVLIFVSAERALEIAGTIAQDFATRMGETGITLSVGVLLMPEQTPVRFARELVEQLLKRAKEAAKSDQPEGQGSLADGSTIDFMALKAMTMISETITEYRRDAFVRKRQGTPLALTQRPYTVERLNNLIAAGRDLARARFPRSQLYQLRELVQDGRQLQAMVDYRYYVERGKQRRDGAQPYRAFDTHMAALCEGESWLPWRRTSSNAIPYDTPILDLIEIAPFVTAGPGRAEEVL